MNNSDKVSEEKGIDSNEKKQELKIDPRILAAVKMLEISFDNSRAYSDTIDTEEKRIEQIDRIQDALDSASHKENAALCKSHKYRRY